MGISSPNIGENQSQIRNLSSKNKEEKIMRKKKRRPNMSDGKTFNQEQYTDHPYRLDNKNNEQLCFPK